MRARVDLLNRISLPVAMAALMMLGALALGVVAWWRFDANQHQRAAAHREVVEARRAISTLRASRDDVREYWLRYQALLDSGAIGNFDKPRALDRFEASLRPFADQIEAYSLAARASADPEQSGRLTHHDVFRHGLSFEMRPLHEESFLQMLDNVERNTNGVAAVEQCELRRAAGSGSSMLQASCAMNWYGFVPRGGGTQAAAPMANPMATPVMTPAGAGVRR